MKWSLFFLLFMAAIHMASCRKHDFRVTVINVPELKHSACASIIQNALTGQPGIRSVQPDLEERTLTINYDSMQIALKNLEFVIAGAGFDANDIPAKPEAAAELPPECRKNATDPA